MRIEVDDLSRSAIHALLNEHLQSMYALSPPESVHALDLERLRKPEITFWSAWDGPVLVGCGALKELDAKHAQSLYESFGFAYCGPFGEYKEDPNSVFMTIHL